MKNTVIIIPTRLGAKRFPNKPLAIINGLPMIVHVMNRAKESKIGDVYIATPDKEILDVVKKNGGQSILTKKNHSSGTDRIFEAYLSIQKNDIDLIINLQGDMPNIKPNSILQLEKLMRTSVASIGTLASEIQNKEEIIDPNIVKVQVDKYIEDNDFVDAKDFFRIKKDLTSGNIYHHIGIYAFTSTALTKYVKLERTKLEIERNLEQMRAMENDMIIKVGFSNSVPLGVDIESDLKKISKEMN